MIVMGLDQYAYRIPRYLRINNLTFDNGGMDYFHGFDFHYWRKHYCLDRWMEDLYRRKGGKNEFNCNFVELTRQDLDRLISDIKSKNLDYEKDEYCSDEELQRDIKDDLEFCIKAIDYINQGYCIYYSNWW